MIKPSPQVVCLLPNKPAVVAGIPAVIRTASRLSFEEGGVPVFLCGESEAFGRTWRKILDRLAICALSESVLRQALDPDSPVLVLPSDGLPQHQGLHQFLDQAERRGVPASWVWKGHVVCVYLPKAAHFVEQAATRASLHVLLESPATLRVEAAGDAWTSLGNAEEVAAAEKRLYAGLGHDRDGYLSRFDRRFSVALSRRFARTRLTPNQVTAASISVGLAGASLVASAGYASSLLGVFLVWFSAILDGCDGEIARLKLLFTKAGAQFDLFGDHVVNFSVLAATLWHVHRTLPGPRLRLLALLLATGVGMSALTAWWLFQRKPRQLPRGLERTFQRIASRDFVYLLIPLAAAGRLDWFIYGAAIGSQLFWMGLLAASVKNRLETPHGGPAGDTNWPASDLPVPRSRRNASQFASRRNAPIDECAGHGKFR